MKYRLFILSLGLGWMFIFLGGLKLTAQLPSQSSMREILQQVHPNDTIRSYKQPSSYYLSEEQKQGRVQSLYELKSGELWLKKTSNSSFQLMTDSLADAGRLRVSYLLGKGGLHMPGQPYKSKNASLSTWGFRTLGSVKVSGYFNFEKSWEDSLSANLRPALDGITPYYYFTPKAGTYERQDYKMGVNLGYKLIKGRLLTGLGIDYLHNSSYGSVDPRLVGTAMEVTFTPGLAYTNRDLMVGLSLIKGYGREDLDISYKNKRFQTGNSFPERDYFLNMGFGSIIRKSDRVRRNFMDLVGGRLDFSYQPANFQLRGQLSYQKHYQDSHSTPDTLLASDQLARWVMNHYQGWLQLRTKRAGYHDLWQISWERKKGHDSNIIFNGRNYFATDNKLGLSFLRNNIKATKSSPLEWGLEADYNTLKRTDVLSAHSLSAEWLSGQLNGSLLLTAGQGSFWLLGWTPGIYYPLEVKASVPVTQQNDFTKQVLLPMARYLQMLKLSNHLELSYVTPKMIPGVYSGFELGLDYVHRLSEKGDSKLDLPESLKENVPKLGTSRLIFNLAFNIYL